MGWLVTLILGGLAGFAAEKIMKADMGIIMNVVLGIAGAFVANFILNMLGIFTSGGLVAWAVTAVAGACLLIFAYRAISSRR